MLPNEPAPLPYEVVAFADATPEPARPGRLRRIAAVALVGGLAAAWFVTTRLGRSDTPATAAPAEVAAPAATPRPSLDAALRRMLPEGAECHDQDGSGNRARCIVGGIAVEYHVLPAAAVRPSYLAAVGAEAGRSGATGRAACARGAEEERAWSRPTAPGVVAGRYACRVEQGRAAMWWTADDRGLLAHTIASDTDLPSLFVWWESHSER